MKLNLREENIWVVIVIGYIAGMVISRIGSFCIEPFLKKVKFVKYESKERYIKAEYKDKKIQELLIDSNMFRTMSAACILLLIVYVMDRLLDLFQMSYLIRWIIGLLILFVIFVMAYILQTKKICKRIAVAIEEDDM